MTPRALSFRPTSMEFMASTRRVEGRRRRTSETSGCTDRICGVLASVAGLCGVFRRPELVCHHSVAYHAHCCRPNDCGALPLPSGELRECRWSEASLQIAWTMSRVQEVPQVSDVPFPIGRCPHLESEHHFHCCPCRWPTPRVHLVRVLASRLDQWYHCCRCPLSRYRQHPETCLTVRTKQISAAIVGLDCPQR